MAAMPISSTCCAHLSALMAGSRYSRMKLEYAETERLSPFANLRYANVLLAKLNARSSIVAGRPFEGNDTLEGNQSCRASFSQPHAVLHPLMY